MVEGKGVGLAKYAKIRGGSVTSTELVGQMNRQKLCDSHRGGLKTHDFDLRVVECIGRGGGVKTLLSGVCENVASHYRGQWR